MLNFTDIGGCVKVKRDISQTKNFFELKRTFSSTHTLFIFMYSQVALCD